MTISRWWFQIFLEFSPLFGEDSHFDEHIFQMGWFNHQPDLLKRNGNAKLTFVLSWCLASFQDRIGKWSLMDNIILFLFVWDPSDAAFLQLKDTHMRTTTMYWSLLRNYSHAHRDHFDFVE